MAHSCTLHPVWALNIVDKSTSPPRFVAECHKRQLNQGGFVLLYFAVLWKVKVMFGAHYLKNGWRYRLSYSRAPIGNDTWGIKLSRCLWHDDIMWPRKDKVMVQIYLDANILKTNKDGGSVPKEPPLGKGLRQIKLSRDCDILWLILYRTGGKYLGTCTLFQLSPNGIACVSVCSCRFMTSSNCLSWKPGFSRTTSSLISVPASWLWVTFSAIYHCGDLWINVNTRVSQRQSHLRSGLATLPSVGAIP